jgi:hypothetical protein
VCLLDDNPAMTQFQISPTSPPPPAVAYRYAAYFAPAPESVWGLAGACWLGRDAFSGETQAPPTITGLSAEQQHLLTAAPRHYGWHATLKAPFQLAANVDADELLARLRTLCTTMQPFVMPPLAVRRIDDFLALVPVGDAEQMAAINDVANHCVTGLHPLAQALSRGELDRRRQGGLTPEEDSHLLRWGYPYVFNRFRFHMTLSSSLRGVPEDAVEQLRAASVMHFAHLPPCEFDAVTVFAEPTPGADFVALQRAMLGA